MEATRTIVTSKWLNENLSNPDLIILDASIYSKTSGIIKSNSILTIPGARYFDLEVFKDQYSGLPNTVPSAAYFESECKRLGINSNSEIVVFDNLGIQTSPRVWWLFKLMGHKKVSVLNGGLPHWIKNGFIVEEIVFKNYELGDFKAKKQNNLIINFEDIKRNINKREFIILDARSSGRFNGIEKEPRKHLRSGNIPNSVSLPYKTVLDDGMFKSKEEIKKIFEQKCDFNDELVFSCGSGITACIIMLACEIGFKKNNNTIYDGSWTEWAELNNLINN